MRMFVGSRKQGVTPVLLNHIFLSRICQKLHIDPLSSTNTANTISYALPGVPSGRKDCRATMPFLCLSAGLS